jgi:LmbE family N-acetylglucosaminyl deacetylase
MYAKNGHAVYILETTRGEGGEVGEPPLTTCENLVAFRERAHIKQRRSRRYHQRHQPLARYKDSHGPLP